MGSMKGPTLLLLACTAIAFTSCSTPNTSSVASLDGTAADNLEQVDERPDPLLAFATCMRESGLPDFEDPIVHADGKVEFPDKADKATQGDFQEAFAQCGPLLEDTVLGFSKTADDITQAVDELVELAACIRDAGFDMPDPDASGAFPEFDKEDPAFASAYERCSDSASGGSGK